MCSAEVWQEVSKKYKKGKKNIKHDILVLCRGDPAGLIFKIFGMRVHIADKFQVDCSKPLGATVTQHRVLFPLTLQV